MAKYILKLFLATKDVQLVQKYKNAIAKHNLTKKYPNAGFDLYLPHKVKSNPKTQFINLEIITAMYKQYTFGYNDIYCTKLDPISYYLYPRSSLSKTVFRLANSVGVIDSGYRGELTIALDSREEGESQQYDRLLQITHPSLKAFKVELVDSKEKLGETERGKGGFGSSGK